MLDAERLAPNGEHRRGLAAGVHAWSNPERIIHRARRGPEHDARADADVPHAARLGSKIVVTGDPTQNDLARGERSGLADVSEVLPGIAGIEFVNFGSEDVVRHKLVQRIVSAYKERAEQREQSAR